MYRMTGKEKNLNRNLSTALILTVAFMLNLAVFLRNHSYLYLLLTIVWLVLAVIHFLRYRNEKYKKSS